MSVKEFVYIIRSMIAGRILLLSLAVLPAENRANHRIGEAMQQWLDGELEEIANRKNPKT